MASSQSAEPGVLVVRIGSKKPLPLSVVAELLDALDNDYRRMTRGRNLAVESIHQGSLIASLRDLADWADRANHLLDFVKNIQLLVTEAISGHLKHRGRSRKDALRTVLAIAEAAINGKANAKVVYKSRNGDTVRLEVTPADASVIQNLENLPQNRRLSSLPLEASLVDFDMLAKAAIEATAADAPNGVMVVVRELLQIVRQSPDGRKKLKQLVLSLRDQGYHEAADLIDSK